MNNNIRQEIEKYVMEEFKTITNLDPTEDGYYGARNSIIKEISTLVDLLQKEDINNSNSKFNDEKIKNEINKIEKEYQLNLKKLESENNKNKNTLDLEKEKIKNCYEIDIKKIENDNSKIDNEVRKITYDRELGERKLESEITKIENEVKKMNYDYELNKEKIENEIKKINNDYEINKEKIKIESKKNNENTIIEHRKIKTTENKNNMDFDMKIKELNENAEKELGLRTDRFIKVLVDGATVLVPIIFYNVWMKKGFEFEETGTFTSNTFKSLWNRFKPTK